MKKLLPYLKRYTMESILAPLFKLLEVCIDLLVPLVVARMINIGVVNNDRGFLLRCFLVLIFMALVGLAFSITAQFFAARASTGFAADLRQAAECVELGDWHNAETFSRRAEESWEKWTHFRACFADHTPTEAVGEELAAMAANRQEREAAEFAASCARAAEMVQAVGDAHALLWWNLL